MTTIEHIENIFRRMRWASEMIHGARLRSDYQYTTDLIKMALKKGELAMEEVEYELSQFPSHWVEAARHIYYLRLNSKRIQ